MMMIWWYDAADDDDDDGNNDDTPLGEDFSRMWFPIVPALVHVRRSGASGFFLDSAEVPKSWFSFPTC